MKVRVCPKCGKHNLESDWSCVDCGSTLAIDTLSDWDNESETPTAQSPPPNIEKLLQNLRSGNAASREAAAEQLHRLKYSDERIIDALQTARASESNKYAKGAIEEALHALGYENFAHEGETLNEPQPEVIQSKRLDTMANEDGLSYCTQCGTKLPQEAKFCYKCGTPITQDVKQEKPKASSGRVQTERSSFTKAQNFRCPQCKRDDKIQKVSAIVASQTREISGGSWATEVYVDKKGKKQTEDHYVPYSATEMSVLAQRLSPPAKPDAGSNMAGIFAVIGLLGPAAICGCIGVSAETSELIILALIVGVIGGVVFLSSGETHKKRGEQVQRVEIPRWEKAIDRWNQLYYCFRDDSVFIPSEKPTSIAQMMDYLYQE